MRHLRNAFIILLLASGSLWGQAADQQSFSRQHTALVLVDIQMFYFEGGQMALKNPEVAGKKAGRLLKAFRENGMEVIHVRHDASTNAKIHPDVAPWEGEPVVTKREANGFVNTRLEEILREKGINHLIIAGMMTHMCVEATARAAHDLGFDVTVAEDACATRDIQYANATVSAREVHLSTLATLSGSYGKISTVAKLEKAIKNAD